MFVVLVFVLVAMYFPNHGRALSSAAFACGVIDRCAVGLLDFVGGGKNAAAPNCDYKNARAADVAVVMFASTCFALWASFLVAFDTTDTVLGPNAFYLTYTYSTIVIVAFCIFGAWAIIDGGDSATKEIYAHRNHASKILFTALAIANAYVIPCTAALAFALSDVYDETDVAPIAAAYYYGRMMRATQDASASALSRHVFFFIGVGIFIWTGAQASAQSGTWDWVWLAAIMWVLQRLTS